jgi:hypothetical protein
MRHSKFVAMRSLAMGIPIHHLNVTKHPVLSGAVKVVPYVPPAWKYGERSNQQPTRRQS